MERRPSIRIEGAGAMPEENTEAQQRIEEIRERIDEIDCKLVQLLNERAAMSLEIRNLKPQVHWGLYDPKREEEIFENLARCNEGPLYAENLREIYASILHVMKELRG
jgi:chorismate mutase